METCEYEEKRAWGKWLCAVLADKLAGTGLRPEVEYDPVDDGPDRFLLRIVCPLEWRVSNWLRGGDITLEKALEITDVILVFHREAWPERMCTDAQYDLFHQVPGTYEWLTEQAPDILYGVTMRQLQRHYGPRCVKGITLYEDLLVVHARWAGDFYIAIDQYRKRLDEVVHAMKAFMQKPIRHPYLYRLRHGKDPEK